MRFFVKSAIVVLVCGVGLCISSAQPPLPQSGTSSAVPPTPARKTERTLTQDERLSAQQPLQRPGSSSGAPAKPTRKADGTLTHDERLSAQQALQRPGSSSGVRAKPARKPQRSLTQDERLSIIAAALDPKVRRDSAHDCSHLVHAIYERAGFPYVYASSDDLYDGLEGFLRVTQPQTGDIIVWPGHAGIVVRPSHHVFFSFLTAGPGIDDYHSRYWIGRGEPRFYRYVKSGHCAGCTSVSRVRPTR